MQGLFFIFGIYTCHITFYIFQLKFHNFRENTFLQAPSKSGHHTASIVFREIKDDGDSPYLPLISDGIPGFDHIALTLDDTVYEVHPGYGRGIYYSKSGKDSVQIDNISGFQRQHTLKTFAYNSRTTTRSPVKQFVSVPIPRALATKMLDVIDSLPRVHYKHLDFQFQNLKNALSPESQKGGNGTFTCSGIIEWAAERSGLNNGKGFVPDELEYTLIPDPFNFFMPTKMPTLSPQLIYLCISEK